MSATVTAVPTVALHRASDTSCCLHPGVSDVLPRRLCTSQTLAHSHLDVEVAPFALPAGGPDADETTSALVSMIGDLTAATIDPIVWRAVVDYATFARWVVVDLSRTERVDERGAALVEALFHATTAVGGNVTVHDPGLVVEHVLRCCGLTEAVAVCHPIGDRTVHVSHEARLDLRVSS